MNIEKPSGIFMFNAPGNESPATEFQRRGQKYE